MNLVISYFKNMIKVEPWKPVLVKHSNISKLAQWIRERDRSDDFYKFYTTEGLAKEMYQLNVVSYQAENKRAKKVKPFKFTYEAWPYNDKGRAQAYRSLSYFLLHSGCGGASETELYKKLREKLRFWARDIAEDWAIEQGAQWE